MNGGMRRRAIINPFTQPQSVPARTPATIPSITESVETIVIVPTTPENARIEPTDRSIPPETITRVMPSAMMLITAVWRITLEMFVVVRKYGETIDKITNSAAKLINGKNRWTTEFSLGIATRSRYCVTA